MFPSSYLVQDTCISSEGCAKVRDFASRNRLLVVGVFVAGRERAAGAIVALVDAFNASNDSEVEIITVADVTAVPSESCSVLSSLVEHLVGALGVDVCGDISA